MIKFEIIPVRYLPDLTQIDTPDFLHPDLTPILTLRTPRRVIRTRQGTLRAPDQNPVL